MAPDSDIFEVEKILGRKLVRGKPLYLIRWRRFGPEENTWEPVKNLSTCMKLVAVFEENNKDLEKIPKGNGKKSNKKYGKVALKLVKKSKESHAGVSKKDNGKDSTKKTVKRTSDCSFAKDKEQRHKSKGKPKLSSDSNKKRKHSSLESGLARSESDFSDDDNILYSLNDDLGVVEVKTEETKDSKTAELKAKLKKEKRKLKKLKLDIKKHEKVDIPGSGCMGNGVKQGNEVNHKQKIRMIDSIKTKVFQPVQRPVSPMTGFTTVKSMSASSGMCSGMMHGSPNPARPANVMDSYFGDVPAASVVPMIPSSPSAISYKTLLDNLPHQLHPKKTPKKEEPDNDDDDVEIIERRQSVRASECAFRYKEIVVKKCPGYTQIWLFTNTKQKNALNPQVIQEIISAMNYAKYDDSRLVMFSGLGTMFCSGVDLHFLLSEDRKVAARKMVDAIRDLTKTFLTFPKPVVAVVNGPAIGLGVGLLPLCDVIYASDKASCYLPYGRLGQTPESCLSFTLPHLIGFPMANELLFAGRKITAIEAYQLGLVSQVFWPTSMMQDVIPRVQNMAMNSAKAQEATKLLIRSHQRTKLELTSETECNLLYDRWTSSECHRYILSYLEDEKNLVL